MSAIFYKIHRPYAFAESSVNSILLSSPASNLSAYSTWKFTIIWSRDGRRLRRDLREHGKWMEITFVGLIRWAFWFWWNSRLFTAVRVFVKDEEIPNRVFLMWWVINPVLSDTSSGALPVPVFWEEQPTDLIEPYPYTYIFPSPCQGRLTEVCPSANSPPVFAPASGY